MTFTPTEVQSEVWGSVGITIGGEDFTTYRGVPTQIQNWSKAEPFSDKTAVLVFPGISSFEPIESLPFGEEANVELWRVSEEGGFDYTIWEGFIASFSSDLNESSDALTVECKGALYQIDDFVKPPSFGFQPIDAGVAIATEVNLRSRHYGLRLAQMSQGVWANTPTRKLGSFNKMLTGWTQEILSEAQTPSFLAQNEGATAIVPAENGYWIGGDHGSVISFGKRMPNYGSSTWKNITKIYTNKDPGWYVADFAMSSDADHGWWVSHGGTVWPMGGEHRPPWRASYNHYGDAEGLSQYPMVAINATPSGAGYWLANSRGSVWSYGDAVFFGATPPLTSRTSQAGHTFPDLIVDMINKPDGTGYWLLSWCGRLYAYGSATAFVSELPLVDQVYTSMAVTSDGEGLWCMDAAGRVRNLGSAPNYGDAGLDNGLIWKDIARSYTNNGWTAVRDDGYITTKGDALNYGSAIFEPNSPTNGGEPIGYTLTKQEARLPVLRTKDLWTAHWSITTGTPGVTHSLQRDRSVAPNVYFGEGQDVNGQKWRNTKYGNAFPHSGEWSPPVYPGFTINPYTNNTDATTNGAVSVWQQGMKANGWDIATDGIFDTYDSNVTRQLQAAAGLEVTGVVDVPTWATTFLNSPINLESTTSEAYIAPLIEDTRVEPFTYKGNGEIMGNNPNHDTSVMRRETYSNYGEKSSKPEAMVSAFAQMKRFSDPGWYGTIVLNTDPEEGFRLDIWEGENIVLKGFKGQDLFLHITEVNVNYETFAVTLTVDTKARDAVTVSALIERDRTIGDTGLKPTRMYSKAKLTDDDLTVFDSEASAGYVPTHATPGGQWNVIRVPFGEIGDIVKTEFQTYPATIYSIAVFDRPITPRFLNDYTRLLSIEDDGIMSSEFWTAFQDNAPDKGLMVAWGGQGSLCGTSPYEWDKVVENIDLVQDGEPPTSDARVTGVFTDTSPWTYWSSQPPWVWVAIWSFSTTLIQGRFYGGTSGGFNFSDVDTLANPQKISSQGVGAIGRDLTFAEQMAYIRGWTA